MSQQTSNANANTMQSVWNKTPPALPRPINETDFPTPIVAAQLAAEERKARNASQKERKALAGDKEVKEKAKSMVNATAEKTLLTPLSAAPHKPPQLVEEALASGPESEGEGKDNSQGVQTPSCEDSLFSPVLKGAKAGRARLAQGRDDPPVYPGGDTITSQNRFEVLGQSDHTLSNEADYPPPKIADTETGPIPQNRLRAPKPRKAARKGELHPRGTRRPQEEGLISRLNTPSPKSRRGETPYDGRDSPLAGHRARGRQDRRTSELHSELGGGANEDPEWGDVENLDELDISAIIDTAPTHAETQPAPGREHHRETPIATATHHRTTPETEDHTTGGKRDGEVGAEGAVGASQRRTDDNSERASNHATTPSQEPNAEMTVDDEMPQVITQPLPTHEPTTTKIHELEFSFPTEDFELPRGNDPCYAYDNLDNEQMEGWPETMGHSFLVRQAGRGCPTAATEQARKEEILSLLKRTIGLPQDARITAPAAIAPFSGNRHPPHNFLVYNIDQAYFDNTTSFGGCISTKEGTLFFSPNFPVFDSLLGSINGFGGATADQVHALVNRSFDKGNLNAVLKRIIEGQDLGGRLTTDEAIAKIRRSLGVRIVAPRSDGGEATRAAHIFMDPPTHDIAQWREFRDHAMKVSFKDPFLGMHITAFPGWICGICTSKLHTTAICPIITERGWLYDQDLKSKPQVKKQPEAKATRPPPLSFSTVQMGSTRDDAKPGRGGRGGRGRGNSSRGDRGKSGRGRS
ncbi:hypothetical protein BC835DRAFT_1308836 [Cytidiella melzeri]|nr:hypothetical protein BC835DRAFT_1308836 [Cytidiella melzeri]